ncbi:hypothetical protein LEP1GSC084_0081 [Leptospira interrogans serovar Medanensis str. L0448]|uniref:Uncharacterized protein n=3 Tax=Leptospira interrogans TaxID=173 RepID=Q8F587_LEPIN|nr:hypothetical protein [Leptospira interrogans]AAN48996.1 hypothetical protein LA_1797 [Leptospira interrogans serovar Lai str. 56601]AER02248.1 hypothetical protein LIF_A1447 [Leptospira interrogans serovar Lai str. IPAV]EKR55938.1 hypothetical protein LEP1GSC105_0631 [Leptospira interrogans str. UI 12758]MCR8640290.1 hypothetical protein [Leptospira interrogans serovar Ricardi]QOI36701.1 hypothetical protein LeptoLang_21135 [Leptospira interrogans serovar Icterohaemorrhagiae]QOI45088.1 hyp
MKPESIVIHFDKIEEKFAVLERAKRAEELARSLSECLASRGTKRMCKAGVRVALAISNRAGSRSP